MCEKPTAESQRSQRNSSLDSVFRRKETMMSKPAAAGYVCLLRTLFMTLVCMGGASSWCLMAAGSPPQKPRIAGPLSVPPNDYFISVHYDLGMHCTGFDLSYCCILPPYNSILSQLVKTSQTIEDLPEVWNDAQLKERGWILWYEHERNTFSEGPKMLYWNVPYDVNRNGIFGEPMDSFANGEFTQLFTYGDTLWNYRTAQGTNRRYLGIDLNIPQDHGPTGKPMSHSNLEYTGSNGTIVYTLINDDLGEVPIPLSQRHYFEALGLPLTSFFDGTVNFIRGITEEVVRPYQIARVTLAKWTDQNEDGSPQKEETKPVVQKSGRAAEFFGSNPIDHPPCERCHAGKVSNGDQFRLYQREFDFWKNTFPNTSTYFAKVKAASVSMLEIHDKKNGTDFLKKYDPADKTGAAITRLGRQAIKCQECHADNVIGVLRSAPDPRTGKKTSPLTVAIHRKHLAVQPQPDSLGRTASCQGCHPAHNQNGDLSQLIIDENGQFRGGDSRDYKGCYTGRDVHAHGQGQAVLKTRSHLNSVGQWLKTSVMGRGKGLHCTNCHNLGSRLLYKADQLENVLTWEGTTLRNKNIDEVVTALRKMDKGRYADYSVEDFFDPKVVPKDRVVVVWEDSWNDPYSAVDDGGDYWLSAGEPHCADCHTSPFVEAIGGTYFPVDQDQKLALMRYSKGHQKVSCQSCHQSTHGLFPVNPEGPDPTSRLQAAQYNPDGSLGPVKCAACHVTDKEGVPAILNDETLKPFPVSVYPTRYERAVAYAHARRDTGDVQRARPEP